MNVGVVFDAGPAAYAGVQIEFFRSLLESCRSGNGAKVEISHNDFQGADLSRRFCTAR
jgi:hypothetical protein